MPGMIDAILQELEREADATRRCLERVPEDKLSWKPHEKSYSLGALALHIAQSPGRVASMAAKDNPEPPGFRQQEATARAQVLSELDASLKTARETLQGMDDAKLLTKWTLVKDGKEIFSVPRVGLLRTIMLNHWYHHRGQLTVYLRLLGVPVPSVYGPSADENPFAAKG